MSKNLIYLKIIYLFCTLIFLFWGIWCNDNIAIYILGGFILLTILHYICIAIKSNDNFILVIKLCLLIFCVVVTIYCNFISNTLLSRENVIFLNISVGLIFVNDYIGYFFAKHKK